MSWKLEGIIDRTTFRALETIEEEEAMGFNDLHEEVEGSRNTLRRRLDRMAEIGWIREEKGEEFPFRTELTLTEEGEMAISSLKGVHGAYVSAQRRKERGY